MIRKATLDDIPSMAQTEAISFRTAQYPVDEESFYELMLDPAQVILVYDNVVQGVCGHLLAEIGGDKENLSIDSVAVMPAYRGQGIGKGLIKAAITYAQNRKIPSVSLETPENDAKLHEFYKNLHFKVAGRQENFYGDGSGCLIMKLVFILLLLLPLPARAQDAISLQLPVACQPGASCWLVNYPDSDAASESAKDFTCGPLTYDTHDGSDFGVLDLVSMEKGVPVLAAAAGRVLRLRDGAEDVMPGKDDIAKLLQEKKGCGNGIVLEHQDGWQTLYCHMKQGSFRVKEGQQVKAGDPLGLVGHSGIAEFPHLHFTVMKNSVIYDPFTGNRSDTPCNSAGVTLWNPPLTYEPAALYAAGFKAGIPDMDALRIDATAPETLRRNETDALTFWVMIYGAALGDKIEMDIIGPDDKPVAHREIIQEKTRARQFYYIGKRFGEKLAATGSYTGLITLTRTTPDGKTLVRTRNTAVRVN